jgi:predicted GH43/DUF377 family glycosyl hydrolase
MINLLLPLLFIFQPHSTSKHYTSDFPTPKTGFYDAWEGHRPDQFGDPCTQEDPFVEVVVENETEDPFLNLTKLSQNLVVETKEIIIPGFKSAFNPSVIKWNGSILMSFRERNESGISTFRMGLVWLDKNFDIASPAQIIEIPPSNESSVVKCQDPRLVKIKDKLFIVYSNVLDPQPGVGENRRMFVSELTYDGRTFTASVPFCLINFDGERIQRWEKNWAPFDFEGNMLLAYGIEPHRIMFPNAEMQRVDTVANSSGNLNWEWGIARGGTPPIIEGDEYLAFFHSAKNIQTMESNGQNITHYFFGAYTFSADSPFTITKISPSPIIAPSFYDVTHDYKTWKPLRVVFPCGHYCDEEFVWITYGKQDYECWVAKLDKKQLLKSLVPVEPR